MYNDDHSDKVPSTKYKVKPKKEGNSEKNHWWQKSRSTAVANGDSTGTTSTDSETAHGDVEANGAEGHSEDEEEVEQPQMSVPLTIGLLVVVTVVSGLFLRNSPVSVRFID